MRHSELLSAAFLLNCATGSLLGRPFDDSALKSVFPAYAFHPQKPLNLPHITSNPGPFKAGNYSVKKQDNSICTTNGEDQWTGTVDVTDERRLFFWHIESRNDPANDPVILWMNGGPGGSSMIGLFAEMGPCVLSVNETETIPNPWAWNNNASLIFLDQPAGVGFSALADGATQPAYDIDGAEDFQMFLNTFFNKMFPEKALLPIYIAAESYGGHFAPTYVQHILKSRAYDSKHAFWGNITSLILVNALLDFTATGVGAYELLCSEYRGRGILTDEECDNIRRATPELIRLGQMCELSEDGRECFAMMLYFTEKVDAYYRARIMTGERNMYNINYGCDTPPVCEDFQHGNISWYLDQKHVKSALDIPQSHTYVALNLTYELPSLMCGDSFRTTTRELGAILDAYETTKLADIRVLVLQGNEDYVVNTPGQVWRYDNLRWGGQAEYRINKWADMPEEIGATGFWKGTKDSRLVFVGVDSAGHTAPGEAGEASYKILQKWMKKEW